MAIPAEVEEMPPAKGIHTIASSNNIRQLPASLASDGVSKSRLQNSTHLSRRPSAQVSRLTEQRSWCESSTDKTATWSLVPDNPSSALPLPKPSFQLLPHDQEPNPNTTAQGPRAFEPRRSLQFAAKKG